MKTILIGMLIASNMFCLNSLRHANGQVIEIIKEVDRAVIVLKEEVPIHGIVFDAQKMNDYCYGEGWGLPQHLKDLDGNVNPTTYEVTK